MGIVSIDQAHDHLNITQSSTGDDAELARFIDAASEAVEMYTGQVVSPRQVTERHTVPDSGLVLLRCCPVLSVVEAVPSGASESVDVSGIVVDPTVGQLDVRAAGLGGDVEFTVMAGMPSPPQRYVAATLIIVAHLWQSQRVSTVGAAPSFGNDGLPALAGFGFALPNRALELLGGRAPNLP